MGQTTMSRLDINFPEAEAFLDALASEETFTFQTFPDCKNPAEEQKRNLTRQFHGVFAEHRDELARLNEQGAGVFVTVNETDGTGRSKDNITNVRAVFIDLDGAPLEPVERFELPPSVINNTSDGKWHAYWLVDSLELSEFTPLQEAIADRFDGDPSPKDLPRVMRIPGFYHLKGEPQLSRLQFVDADRRYTAEQIIEAFPPRPKPEPTQSNEVSVSGSIKAKLLGLQAAEKSRATPGNSRHSIAVTLGYDCRRAGLSQADTEIAATAFADNARETTPSGDLDPFDTREAIDAALNAYADGKEVSPLDTLAQHVVGVGDLLELELPSREVLVEPFIVGHSLNMIVAKRGVGKTWFSLQLAADLARGNKFLAWDVPQSRRVLYVDGEMPLADLQARLSAILHGESVDNLIILPSETLYLEGQPLTINLPKQQERFGQMLDELELQGQLPEVIIFDNLSSLTSGMDENSNSDLDDFLQWLLKLRHRGLAVILVHHAGKNGEQRGASRREDLLDTSIMLKEPISDEFTLRQGACFEISFTKTRGKRPQPDVIEIELAADERGNVAWRMGDARNVPAWLKSLKVIRDEKPATQMELAAILNVTEPAVVKQLKTPRSKGYLEERKLRLTAEGARLVERAFDSF